MECLVNKPYPKVEVQGKNIKYAHLLLEDYAGLTSEETAIHQYSYQNFNTFLLDCDFATILSQIAMVEMKHLELLGKTIKLLGVDPKMITKNHPFFTYWSSSFVDYTTDKIAMLQSNIEIERKTIQNYKCHIRLIHDPFIQRLLERIIEDEEKHIQCFEQLLLNEKLLHQRKKF